MWKECLIIRQEHFTNDSHNEIGWQFETTKMTHPKRNSVLQPPLACVDAHRKRKYIHRRLTTTVEMFLTLLAKFIISIPASWRKSFWNNSCWRQRFLDASLGLHSSMHNEEINPKVSIDYCPNHDSPPWRMQEYTVHYGFSCILELFHQRMTQKRDSEKTILHKPAGWNYCCFIRRMAASWHCVMMFSLYGRQHLSRAARSLWVTVTGWIAVTAAVRKRSCRCAQQTWRSYWAAAGQVSWLSMHPYTACTCTLFSCFHHACSELHTKRCLWAIGIVPCTVMEFETLLLVKIMCLPQHDIFIQISNYESSPKKSKDFCFAVLKCLSIHDITTHTHGD